MNLESLSYQCELCLAWHEKGKCNSTYHGVSESGHTIETLWCDCGGQVLDAHETGAITPYGEMKLELLESQRQAYLQMVIDIEKQMTEIDGARR